ncbi:Rapid ALkalinization Factor (RALF) [Musa troglodytarum]|uniref:Rapid ALkalinization Factor (RALF) n=1 Tax=Musa troglodytarum TaxID=320322 RepID=A0A9E7GHG5_9LILI|nr:Rapid ALkalinization Factor (RALF) [Musa troglodytarum]
MPQVTPVVYVALFTRQLKLLKPCYMWRADGTARKIQQANLGQEEGDGKAQLRLHFKEEPDPFGINNTAERVAVKLPCNGRVGGCLMEEVEMSSEENRRLLWSVTGKRYISYEALRRDAVPCTRPGLPYHSCHASPWANPCSRGCQIVSVCRGDSP